MPEQAGRLGNAHGGACMGVRNKLCLLWMSGRRTYLFTRQTLMVRSQLPAARHPPSPLIARHSTSPVCFNAPLSRQVSVSHSLISLGRFQSPSVVASVRPSGVKATAHTSVPLPVIVFTSFLVAASHTRTT